MCGAGGPVSPAASGALDPEYLPDWPGYQDALVRRAVEYAAARSPEVAARLARAGVPPERIRRVGDLPLVPVLPKDSLPDLQAASPPFGGMLAVPVEGLARIYMSPGPILDPQGHVEDYWRVAPALRAAGFTPGHVVLNTFSYHLTPGGAMLDGGLRSVGCVVIPGGVGNSEAQIELARAAGVTGYVGTAQFLARLLEKATGLGTSLALERALVTGGPFPPSLRATVCEEHGVDAYESYGTADAGTLAYECPEKSGWHVAPGVAIEIVDPATGKPVMPGEAGEVVVTAPDETYPLVRFGTGDLSAFADGACPCGRTSGRLRGFLGRVGEGVKVKGMFVHPRQIARVLHAHPAVAAWQGVVAGAGHTDRLTVRVEVEDSADLDGVGLKRVLEKAVRLRLELEVVARGVVGDRKNRLLDERTP